MTHSPKIIFFIFLLVFFSLLVRASSQDWVRPIPLLPEAAYAEMWGRQITNITISAPGVYENITGLVVGHISNVVFNSSKFIIVEPGIYKISSQFAFSDGANTEFHLAMGKNGIRDEHCHTERKIGTGGDVGSASFTCIDNVTTGDILTVMVENVDNTNDPEIHSINFNILKIV